MCSATNKLPHFVQFTHPGHEHGSDRDSKDRKGWNTGGHRRKFLAAPGEYVMENGRLQTSELLFWGEWEAPSHVQSLPGQKDKLYPKWLHRPCFPVPSPPAVAAGASSACKPTKRPTITCGGGCAASSSLRPQNTDPFVFGPCFKYFVCKQYRKQKHGKALIAHPTGLSRLEDGSVILFGSTHGKGRAAFFQLDTVFVVGRSIPYNPAKPENLQSDPLVDPDFLKASFHTALPVTDCEVPAGLELRLYLGATIENPVDGMYSFSPAKVLKVTPEGFSRVQLREKDLKLPGHSNFLTNNLNSAPKRTESTPAVVRTLWETVLYKCRDHGCVPGVRFHLRSQP
jgi:hypothetical protein